MSSTGGSDHRDKSLWNGEVTFGARKIVLYELNLDLWEPTRSYLGDYQELLVRVRIGIDFLRSDTSRRLSNELLILASGFLQQICR